MEEMQGDLELLTKTLFKFNRVSKMAMDFGVGVAIYPAEIHTVERLCKYGPMSITELAEATGVTKGAMSQMVSKMTRKGLVYRETAPDNQSKQAIIPTELGEKAQKGHMEFHMKHDKDFFAYIASLPDEEYAVFSKLCQNMEAWMNSYLT